MGEKDMLSFPSFANQFPQKQEYSFSGYHAKIYDLMDPNGRNEFERTMNDVTKDVNAGKCVIWRNERSIMTKPDGSQSWFAYIEWSDYEFKENKLK